MFRTAALAVLATIVSSPIALAQTAPCVSANDANNTFNNNVITGYGFAGQNSFAWQFTPTAAQVIQSARIFTRNSQLSGDRYMAIEIWDDNGGGPGNRLAGGAWQIVNSRPIGWQGANFDQFAILLPATSYWVVWTDPGWSTPPVEPGGITVLPHMSRTGTGSWSTNSPQAPKFRLFCNQLDDLNSTPFGVSCPLSSGTLPTMYTNEQPAIGNTGFFFESSGNPPGGAVFAVIGGDPSFVSAPVVGLPAACMQNTDVLATVLLFAGTGDTRGPTFDGHLRLDFVIPSDPGLTGVFFATQAVPLDLGAATSLPFGTSNAHRITLF